MPVQHENDTLDHQFILFGGGDFAVEVATYLMDLSYYWNLAQITDEADASKIVADVISSDIARESDFEKILGYSPEFHRDIEDVRDILKKKVIICIGDPHVRERIYNDLVSKNVAFGTVIHPKSYVANTAQIGLGAIVCPFAFVGPFANIGNNCAINTLAVVGHDVVLGQSTVLSPNAAINGRGQTGKAAFLGAGAVMHPKTHLGSYSKLASGSVLNSSAGDGFIMHGNPAKGRQMMKLP